MLIIHVELTTYIFGDNHSVLVNSSNPHSRSNKKSSSIVFHLVREGAAKDGWRVDYLNTDYNSAEIATKSLDGGEKRSCFTFYLLHYVYD